MAFIVLVIEDEPKWREALCQMYEEILSSLSPTIKSASSGQDALRMIRDERFDLISLDINLGGTHPKTLDGVPDRRIAGADGRTILEKAHQWGACNGVIVITGAPYDETLRVVMPDDKEHNEVKIALNPYLEKRFPGRTLYFIKDPKMTVADSVKFYKEHLTLKRITDLCKAGLQPPYIIDLLVYSSKKCILIKSQKDRNKKPVTIENDKDVVFFEALCGMNKLPPYYLSKEAVCRLYRSNTIKLEESKISQYAETDINTLKRQFKKKGIEPNAIFQVERGKGWKLHPDVVLHGFASVDKRSPGIYAGENPDSDVMNELSDNDASHSLFEDKMIKEIDSKHNKR